MKTNFQGRIEIKTRSSRLSARALSRCLVLCGGATLMGSACDPPFTITTDPPLFPAWDWQVTDYVTRCTGAPVQVSVDGNSDHKAAIDGVNVPVGTSRTVALTPGQAFTIDVDFPIGFEYRYNVRCLPSDFPEFTAERPGLPQAEYYVAAPWGAVSGAPPLPAGFSNQYVAVFSNYGVPVWWRKSTGSTQPLDAKLLPNGNIAWMYFSSFTTGAGGGAEQRRLDGTLVTTPNTVGSPADFHEIQLLPNGNYVMGRYFPKANVDLTPCGGLANATMTDNDIQELTPAGTLVWQWIASNHIPLSEVKWRSQCASTVAQSDVYHFNSIERTGDAYLVSFRHLDAVYKISRSTGAILWKLGGTPRPESLTIIGDPIVAAGGSLFGGQHDARVLPDGTITVYDNRSLQPNQLPRAVRFRINETARTATLIESVTDADVSSSNCCGSARKLPTGNWMNAFGGRPYVTELAPDGSLVFQLTFTQQRFTYRADPVMAGRLSRDALIAGMNAQYPR